MKTFVKIVLILSALFVFTITLLVAYRKDIVTLREKNEINERIYNLEMKVKKLKDHIRGAPNG